MIADGSSVSRSGRGAWRAASLSGAGLTGTGDGASARSAGAGGGGVTLAGAGGGVTRSGGVTRTRDVPCALSGVAGGGGSGRRWRRHGRCGSERGRRPLTRHGRCALDNRLRWRNRFGARERRHRRRHRRPDDDFRRSLDCRRLGDWRRRGGRGLASRNGLNHGCHGRWGRRTVPGTRPSEARDLESHELDSVVGSDQHVLGGERAVDEDEIVSGLESIGDLEGQAQRPLDGQCPLVADHIRQASPVEGLQHQAGGARAHRH